MRTLTVTALLLLLIHIYLLNQRMDTLEKRVEFAQHQLLRHYRYIEGMSGQLQYLMWQRDWLKEPTPDYNFDGDGWNWRW